MHPQKKYIIMECTPLIRDIEKICISYLEHNERIYVKRKWDYFKNDQVCSIAAKNNWTDLFLWGIKNKKNDIVKNDIVKNDIGVYFALNGNLKFLKWLDKHGYLNKSDTEICGNAASNGNLDVIKWARENLYSWDIKTCNNAALNNHFDILKFAIRNSCDIDHDDNDICSNAVLNGNFEMLKWAKKKGCKVNEKTYAYAAKTKNGIEMLKWLRNCDDYNEHKWDYWVCEEAAENGNLDMLKWIYEVEKGWKKRWDTKTCLYAAKNGHLEILKWVKETSPQVEFDREMCSLATVNRHLEVLKWAKINGAKNKLFEHIYLYAVGHNHLDIVKWAYENKYPINGYNLCDVAAENGRLEILKWIRENISDQVDYTNVCRYGARHLNILKYLSECGEKIGDDICNYICETAARYGNLDLLKWIVDEKKLVYNNMMETICYAAVEDDENNKSKKILKWMKSKGYKFDKYVCKFAAFHSNTKILKWLKNNGCSCSGKYHDSKYYNNFELF